MEERIGNKSKAMSLLKVLIFSYLITTIMLFVLAFLLYKFELSQGKVDIGIMVIYIISCFLGGFVFGKKMNQRRFMWGAVLGIFYVILLGVISIAVQRGIARDMSHLITACCICIGAGTIGGMLS